MKKFISLVCALALIVGCMGGALPTAKAAAGDSITYYVSTSGKGGNSGLTEAEPFPGLDAVPWSQLLPGDRVLLNKGDTFPGTIRMVDVHGTADAPITIGTYGTGDAPVIEARGQGIWLPKTGNVAGNVDGGGKYVSSGVTLYDCSYITVQDLHIVNVPDAMKTNFDNLTNTNANRSGDKLTYSGIGVAATDVGAAVGITLTGITVQGDADVQTVKTDTSTAIATSGVTKGATVAPRTYTNANRAYYVSSLSGSDSNDGSSPDQAFYSLHKINELNLQPGAKVYLEYGSVFENQYLHVEGGGDAANPVIIDAYGNTSGPKPLINTNGEGVWYQNYRRNLDNAGHVIHGYVSSCVLLYDVPYVEVRNIAMTNFGRYGETPAADPDLAARGSFDAGTVPGETGYAGAGDHAGDKVGCYQWQPKMNRSGVAGVAQNKGTITHTVLRNLDIENIFGNIINKHVDNGGIYFTVSYPLNESETGIARYDDLRIEGCYLKRVSRWGIAAVHTTYYNQISPNGQKTVPDAACQQYGATNVYVGHNYLEEVGGDPITLMHAYEPLTEYNVSQLSGREMCGSTTGPRYMNGTYFSQDWSVSAGIWPWKCKTALFEHNECYTMLYSHLGGNNDCQAWDADSGDSTIYQYNYSSGNTGGCIMFCAGDSYNTVFRYNISYKDGMPWAMSNPQNGGTRRGILDPAGSPNGQIYNNTFVVQEGTPVYHYTTSSPHKVENNIFYNLGNTYAPEGGWNAASGPKFVKNIYVGFAQTGTGSYTAKDTSPITMTKSETLFVNNNSFTGAPETPKSTSRDGVRLVNGIRDWTHDWATDFNMFKLDEGASKAINAGLPHNYDCLTQDSDFGVPRVDNDKDFYGNKLDDVHDIGAYDTRTAGGTVEEPVENACELISSLYELRGTPKTNLQVPLGTNISPTVETFLKGLTVSDGATVKVYQSNGTTEVTDNTEKIAAGMKVKIVAADSTVNSTVYAIANKTTYNSQSDWVDNQQGNVWFYQAENNGVFTNQTGMGATYKDWTGSGGAVEQNQAVGDINNSKGAGFTFRAPVSGKVTVTFNYKAADDNAGKASASGVVTGSIRKRASTPNSKWQTYLRTYHNDTEEESKAILIPMDSITAIPVNAMTFTVAQGDTLSFMIRNEEKETTSTSNAGNHGVYYNPVITYVDEAFTEPGDDKAPTAPGGLRAKNVTVNSADLIWNASTDNVGVDHYVITVNGTEILSNSTEPTYALTGLDEDTVYTVTVKAVDEAGNKSGEASITFRTDKTPAPEDTTAPALTGSVTVVGSPTDTTATLSWPAGEDAVGVDHYKVTVNGETVTVRNATEVTLTGLTPETSYTASVEAVDAAGNRSTPALTATFTTAAAVPDVLVAPDVFVMKVSASSADIRWRASDGADGYKVKLGSGAEVDVKNVNRYTFTDLTVNTEYTAYVCAYRGTETTDWVSVTFTTPNVYNSFEDWNDNEQGSIWRYQHQDDTGEIVDHTTWNVGWSGWGGEGPGYKSVQQSQACGSIKKSQGSGYTFIAPETGTVRVSFWNYISPNAPVENQVQKREDTSSNGLNHYIRLYVNGKELTKKAIALRKDTTAQSVQPVTVAVQAGAKLSILAWNDGDFGNTGGNNGVYFNPVITYLSSAYTPEAESATLSQTSATIYTNTNETADRQRTVQLAVENIQPENANPKITWSIRPGDTGIVSVDESGLVTAKGNGTAQVTATVSSDYGDIALNCNVTVRTRMESITVKQNGTAIGTSEPTVYANEGDAGRSITLTADPNPANPTHPNLNWNTVEGEEYQGVISLVKNTNGSSATITAGANETDVGLAKVRVESAEHSDTFTEFTVRVVRKLANGVSITGTPKFDQTLTVNTNQLQMTEAGMNALTYQWYRTPEGGTKTPISEAIGRTYKLVKDDIGKVISVTVTADPDTFYEGEKTASITGTVAKADGGSVAAARAENCTAEGAEDGKIAGLNSGFKHEYRKVTVPESDWTAVGDEATEITGLAPGKYQVRRVETDTHTAGRASELTVLSFEEAADTYAITVGLFDNGEVSASAGYAKANTEITLTIEAAEGYQLAADSLKVYKTGEEATTVDVDDNKFTMPAYPVTVEARFEKQKFTLDHQLKDIDCDQHTTNHEVEYGDTPTIILTAKDGFTMPPAVTVKVTGTEEEFEGYQYTRTSPDSAKITFDQGITQNLTITGAGVVKSYTVNYNIRNLSAPEEEAARSVEHKAAYTGKLVADEGYALPEKILITVGGVSFTDFEYDSATGVIEIAADKITGNLVITSSGVDTSVAPVLVSGVQLSQTSASVKIGNTITLTATVLPDEATEKMVGWSSSDPAVATVDENGEVTALAEGSAIITVTTVDGGLTATCTVTVTKTATSSSNPAVPVISTGTTDDGFPTTTETRPDGTKVDTTEKPDGTKEIVETKPDGTVTETTEKPDGTKESTETKPDGTVTESVEKSDGSKEAVETKPDGTVTETKIDAEGAKVEKVTDPEENVTITATDAEGETVAEVKVPAVIPEAEKRFEDVPVGHWADEAIHKLAAIEVVNGVTDTQYSPVVPMKRGDLATVLFRLSNGKEGLTDTFADVESGKYYADGIAWAAKAGVVEGYSDTEFRPEQTITREQLALMLMRYAKLLGVDTSADAEALNAFADGGKTSSWAVDGVAWCVKAGIIQGMDDVTLSPNTNVSRAQVAVMLQRFIDLVK